MGEESVDLLVVVFRLVDQILKVVEGYRAWGFVAGNLLESAPPYLLGGTLGSCWGSSSWVQTTVVSLGKVVEKELGRASVGLNPSQTVDFPLRPAGRRESVCCWWRTGTTALHRASGAGNVGRPSAGHSIS